MRLVAKFCFALVAGIVCVLAVAGWLQVQREVQLFEGDMARDQAAFARALRTAAEAAADQGGIERAEALIASAARRQRRVRVRWVWADTDPGLSNGDRRALTDGHTVRRVLHAPPAGDRRITLEPLDLPGTRRGAIALSEPLGPQRDAIHHTEWSVVGVTLISIGVCALLVVLLGVWLVGRPMRRLCAFARQVGDGDLDVRLPVTSRDELGVLARELNGMVDQLAAARARVAAETEARIAAIEQLRHADRLRTVGQLASGVAHELGTPLGVVAGRAKMIAAGTLDDATVERNARIIHEQADRMTRIIRQLLDFSRRRRPALAADDVGRLAAQTLDMLASLAPSRRARLLLETGEGPLAASVDHSQLQQAITNLVVNALQAVAPGGTVRVDVARRWATPPTSHGGPSGWWVCVSVEDDGVGIPREHLDRIFEPFFTTKDVGEGTGLGLAVTWGIVDEHGGWVAVHSEVGRGTVFRIYLPPAAEAGEVVEAATA